MCLPWQTIIESDFGDRNIVSHPYWGILLFLLLFLAFILHIEYYGACLGPLCYGPTLPFCLTWKFVPWHEFDGVKSANFIEIETYYGHGHGGDSSSWVGGTQERVSSWARCALGFKCLLAQVDQVNGWPKQSISRCTTCKS